MKFIFNLLLLICFAFLIYIGYNFIVEEKTIAESVENISTVAEGGKTELAKTLLERELNKRLKNKEIKSFGWIDCFFDEEYGASCKIHNLLPFNKELEQKLNGNIDINLYIYNVFEILKLIETKTGFFELTSKIRFELNSTSIAILMPELSNSNQIEKEIFSALQEGIYHDLAINTKKHSYGNIDFNVVSTTGSKNHESTVYISGKFGESTIKAVDDFINKNGKDFEEFSLLMDDIFLKKVRITANMPHGLAPKILYMGIDHPDTLNNYDTWKKSIDSKRLSITSSLYEESKIINASNHVVDNVINFAYGEGELDVTLISKNNSSMRSMFKNQDTFLNSISIE